MKEKIAKLIDVRSIVTFMLTGVFSYLALADRIGEDKFTTIYLMCITFFFGTQVGKNEARSKDSKVE